MVSGICMNGNEQIGVVLVRNLDLPAQAHVVIAIANHYCSIPRRTFNALLDFFGNGERDLFFLQPFDADRTWIIASMASICSGTAGQPKWRSEQWKIVGMRRVRAAR